MTDDKRYNGWTNYETWNVALWMDNDEGSYRHWNATAQVCYDNATADKTFARLERATLDLEEEIKNQITDEAPELGSTCYADLLNAALSEVNWYEIAEHRIESVEQEEPEEIETED